MYAVVDAVGHWAARRGQQALGGIGRRSLTIGAKSTVVIRSLYFIFTVTAGPLTLLQ